jgi:hypothetical protein
MRLNCRFASRQARMGTGWAPALQHRQQDRTQHLLFTSCWVARSQAVAGQIRPAQKSRGNDAAPWCPVVNETTTETKAGRQSSSVCARLAHYAELPRHAGRRRQRPACGQPSSPAYPRSVKHGTVGEICPANTSSKGPAYAARRSTACSANNAPSNDAYPAKFA